MINVDTELPFTFCERCRMFGYEIDHIKTGYEGNMDHWLTITCKNAKMCKTLYANIEKNRGQE